MIDLLQWLHVGAGIVVLAESLNKLERTAPFRPGVCGRTRLLDGLKALAWFLMALGAGGAIISPFIATPLHLDQVCVLVGFAVLIVRTRIKEG